ncbi:MAG: type IV secretion system DNA-binding domain-containing protein [Actinomycetota bacterium]
MLTPSHIGAPRHVVSFEVVAERGRISHYVVCPVALASRLRQLLVAELPSVRWSEIEMFDPVTEFGVEIGVGGGERPLRTDRPDAVSAAVLSAVALQEPGETVVLQWLLGGVKQPAPARLHDSPGFLAQLWNPGPRDADALKGAREKRSEPQFAVVGRVGVASASAERSRLLTVSLLGALRGANESGAWLRSRLLPNGQVARGLNERRIPLVWPGRLNSRELSGVLAWPIGDPQVVGLPSGTARHLVPATELPADATRGVVLGDTTFPGAQRPLVLRDEDRPTHSWSLGPTGSGKSTLLLNLICQDIQRGHPVLVLDPIGDLVERVIDRMPSNRTDDVVLLDPADSRRPVGLNPLEVGSRSADLVVDQIVGVFSNIFRAFWGPRTDDVLRASLLTLATAPEPHTLAEVPTLLTDEGFRRQLTGRLDDPIGLEPFWGWYDGLSDAERAQVIGPVSNKLRAFLLRPALRNVVAQAQPSWSMESLIEERRILLVPLRPGQIGDDAAALLGSLVVARFWQAIQQRASVSAEQRHPVMAYLDEFQDFLNLPTPVGSMLAQARNLGASLTLAHQHLGQLPSDVRQDVLANARTKVAFQLGEADARKLAQTFAPLTSEDLQGIPAYEAVAQLAVGRNAAPPTTILTRPPGGVARHSQARASAFSTAVGCASGDDREVSSRAPHHRSGSADPSRSSVERGVVSWPTACPLVWSRIAPKARTSGAAFLRVGTTHSMVGVCP